MRVSVIVPFFNPGPTFTQCLASLNALHRNEADFQVILVDNNSTDGSDRLASQAGFTVVRETHAQTSYAARNRGLSVADGDIVVFTDSDCVVTPGWLAAFLRAARRDVCAGAFAGRIRAHAPRRLIERFSERRSTLHEEILLQHTYKPFAQTANLAVRREVFDRIGGFRADLVSGGDGDFCWRMQDAGFRLVHVPEAGVAHVHRTCVSGLWEQWFRYGRGQVALSRLHPGYRPPFPAGYSAVLDRARAGALRFADAAVVALDRLGSSEWTGLDPLLDRIRITALGAGILHERAQPYPAMASGPAGLAADRARPAGPDAV